MPDLNLFFAPPEIVVASRAPYRCRGMRGLFLIQVIALTFFHAPWPQANPCYK